MANRKINHKINLKILCCILTISLITLVLAVIAFTVYFFINHASPSSEPDTAPEVSTLNKSDILKSAHAADDYDAFLQVYDDQISATQATATQAYLYRLRASDILSKYYNQDPQDQYKQQAISDILKAYELTPTASIAYDVGTCYDWVGESELAAQYYALAEQGEQ